MVQAKTFKLPKNGRRAQNENVYSQNFNVRDQEPVDAEEVRTRQERRQDRRAERERVRAESAARADAERQRLHDLFQTQQQDRRDERAKAREERRLRRNKGTEKLSDREELGLLRDNIHAAGREYMASLRKSGIFAPGFEEQMKEDEVRKRHDVYSRMMVGACLAPLSRGVDAAAVIRAASMMASMTMLSKSFRTEVKDYLGDVKKAMNERIDKRMEDEGKTQRLGTQAQARADAYNASLGEGSNKPRMKASDYLSKKWARRYEDLQHRERGHREMFTERSAGMTEVALMEMAFDQMRQPGADPKEIRRSYRGMVDRLYRQAEEDGLSREDVAMASQVVLGERMQEDPRVRTMIEGIAHGWVRMSDPETVRVAGSDEPVQMWQGKFEDNWGNPYDQTRYEDPLTKTGIHGAFHLREPQSLKEHQVQMTRTMATTMSDAIERGDMRAFNDSMKSYLNGYTARAQDFDGADMGADVQTRLMQSRTMLGSMVADGFTEEELKFAYSNAFVDSIEALQEAYPDFSKSWAQNFGEDWKDFVRTSVVDPEQAHVVWAANQRAEQHEPSSGRASYESPSGAYAQGPGTAEPEDMQP